MEDTEKALRLEALTEMFIGFGQPVVKERLRYYANITQNIPLGVFKQSCRLAAVETSGGFPPGPGDIIQAALKLSPGRQTPGHGLSKQRWYQRSLQDRRRIALTDGS